MKNPYGFKANLSRYQLFCSSKRHKNVRCNFFFNQINFFISKEHDLSVNSEGQENCIGECIGICTVYLISLFKPILCSNDKWTINKGNSSIPLSSAMTRDDYQCKAIF